MKVHTLACFIRLFQCIFIITLCWLAFGSVGVIVFHCALLAFVWAICAHDRMSP